MKLSQEEFNIIRNHLVLGGWVVEAWSSINNRYQYNLTDEGFLFYKAAICLLKTDRIFNGPRIDPKRIMEECKKFENAYTANKFLITDYKLIQRVVNPNNHKHDYVLTKPGAEWFYVFTRLIGGKVKSSNKSSTTKLAEATLYGMAVALWSFARYAAVKTDTLKKSMNQKQLK